MKPWYFCHPINAYAGHSRADNFRDAWVVFEKLRIPSGLPVWAPWLDLVDPWHVPTPGEESRILDWCLTCVDLCKGIVVVARHGGGIDLGHGQSAELWRAQKNGLMVSWRKPDGEELHRA